MPRLTKVCLRCKKRKPQDEFYFKSRKDNTRRGTCKTCSATRVVRVPVVDDTSLSVDGMKVCGRCNTDKPVELFPQDKRRKDGRFPYCLVCHHGYQKSRKKQNMTGSALDKRCDLCLAPLFGNYNRTYCSEYCKNRVRSLRRKFNLTGEDFRKLMEDCGGRCPICLCKFVKVPIDHNHETMEVLGPVCTRCNTTILVGSKHDLETAKRLVKFLEDPPARRVLGRVVLATEEANDFSSRKRKRMRYLSEATSGQA